MAAILSSLISGVFLFLSFPSYDLWYLAWVAFVPLMAVIARLPRRQSFWLGWLTGIIYFLGCVYWVTHTMVLYGKLPFGISVLMMLLLVLYLGIYVGLFAYLYHWMIERFTPWLHLFIVPSLWVTLEWLRGHLLSGFPWALLGYSQYQILPIIQISDITGVYGVSFVLVAANVAITQILKGFTEHRNWRDGLRQAWSPMGIGLILLGLTLVYGTMRASMVSKDSTSNNLIVGLIQGNIDQAQKWDPTYQRETLEVYKDLSRQALGPQTNQDLRAPLDLMVWPETAVPFFFEQEQIYREELQAFVQGLKTPLLFGSPSIRPTASNGEQDRFRLYNSAYLLSSDGVPAGRYDKIHLVPFGEYVPFSSLLFFVHKLVEGIGDFGAGNEHTVMGFSQTRFGVVICFEVIFPELVREFAKRGAQFMTTLTNDAWFGDSSAPYQHFSMVVFRSVENRVPFVRAANTGITGSIDATGRITVTTPLFVKTHLIQEVSLKKTRSFYTQYGDLFAYLCGIITLASVIYFFRLRRSPTRRIGEGHNP